MCTDTDFGRRWRGRKRFFINNTSPKMKDSCATPSFSRLLNGSNHGAKHERDGVGALGVKYRLCSLHVGNLAAVVSACLAKP